MGKEWVIYSWVAKDQMLTLRSKWTDRATKQKNWSRLCMYLLWSMELNFENE
ncbi:mCG146850 [Mus musculus]|nr:mCG146850 [Mus musculus]